jgi:hypothetical protein
LNLRKKQFKNGGTVQNFEKRRGREAGNGDRKKVRKRGKRIKNIKSKPQKKKR